MLKINSYRLLLLIAIFSNSSNVVCSSFKQSDNHNNLNNVYPHTNPLHFVSHIPIHNNINCDLLPNGLLSTNASNMQQGATHPLAIRSLVLNGPNQININNNINLFLLPFKWDLNGAGNTLLGASNNSTLPPLLDNPVNASTNTDSVAAPIPPLENADNTHTQIHDKGKPFLCDYCPKCFKTKHEKTVHNRTHTGEKPFQCSICGKGFPRKDTLKVHSRTHTGEKPYQCLHCNRCFSRRDSLNIHVRTHTKEKPFKCDICQKGLASKGSLKNHLNRHSGKKPYKCDRCTKAYTTKDGLRTHLKMHNRPKLTCHYCNALFSKKSKYENHIRYEESADEDRKCHLCKKVYVDKYNLARHNKIIHPEV